MKTGKRSNAWKYYLAAGAVLVTCFLCGTFLTQPAAVSAEEAAEDEALDEFLIEDDGEISVVTSGADLEELLAMEETEEETEPMVVVEETDPILEPASADLFQRYLDELTESPTGSDGELINASYIRQVMERYGYTISEQSFHEGFLNADGIDAPGVNLIAERGADSQENRTGDILIICTHYDSKRDPAEGDAFANDKSGVVILLEMARILAFQETDTDVCFLFLSGEEDGLYGSETFVQFLGEDYRERIVGVLNVEKAGYNVEAPYILETVDGEENHIGNLVREEALSEILEISLDGETFETETEDSTAPELSFEEGEEDREEREDWEYAADEEASHSAFAKAGIPAVTVCQDVYGKFEKQRSKNYIQEISGEALTESVSETGTQETMTESEIPTEKQQTMTESETRTEKQETLEESETQTVTAETEEESASFAPDEEVSVDPEELQEITDLLAMTVARIMSDQTGSLLWS